ncbi:MAG: hypothetical protein FWD47_12980 [Treponema sp.]|nr:hypothetical protein [Treponema sp.]
MKKNVFFLLIFTFIMAVSANVYGQSAATGTLARVNEARQRAIDFESHGYFPSEWENLEEKYGNISRGQQTAAVYNNLADEYDALFRKAVPLYAQAWEDDIISTRYFLFGTDFITNFPELLDKVDEIALIAMTQYNAGDYYTARNTAQKALNEYESLLTGVGVFMLRQEIIDRGFDLYDRVNYTNAEEVAQKAINEYYNGNSQEAVNLAEEAILRYNVLLSNGWIVYSHSRQSSAAQERELAMGERAQIASRETFRAAETLHLRAEELFTAENFNESAILFIEAEAMYAISRQETEARRLRALEAIRQAEEKITESSETAIEAERIIEGGIR